MEKKIKFSIEAKYNTNQIISYLTKEWSESTADKFILNLENKLNYEKFISDFISSLRKISGYPEMCFNKTYKLIL